MIETVTKLCQLYVEAQVSFQAVLNSKGKPNSGEDIRFHLNAHLTTTQTYMVTVNHYVAIGGDLPTLMALLSEIK